MVGVDQERKSEELRLKKLVILDARKDPLGAPIVVVLMPVLQNRMISWWRQRGGKVRNGGR